MKTTITDVSATKKKLKLEIPVATVNEAFKNAYRELQKKAKIPGFRQGKIPEAMLDQHYGPDVSYQSLNHLVSITYSKALQENELLPVLDPKFDFPRLEKDKDFTYHAEVEVRPKIELKEYKEIPIHKKAVKIEPKAIEEELNRLQQARAELTPAPEGTSIEKNIMVTMDFEGTVEGKPFEGSSAKGFQFEAGTDSILAPFEQKIWGMKAGESRTVDFNYPDDFRDEKFKGKPAHFEVKIQSLHLKNLPKLDDDFAKDLGKESIDQIKTDIETFLTKREEQKYRQDYAKEVIEHLQKSYNFEVPEGLVQQEMDPHHGHNHGPDEGHDHDHPKKDRGEVEKSLRLQFVLDEIAKKESIQVTAQELERHFQYLASASGQPVAKVKEFFRNQDRLRQVVSQILIEKTLDYLVDQAKGK